MAGHGPASLPLCLEFLRELRSRKPLWSSARAKSTLSLSLSLSPHGSDGLQTCATIELRIDEQRIMSWVSPVVTFRGEQTRSSKPPKTCELIGSASVKVSEAKVSITQHSIRNLAKRNTKAGPHDRRSFKKLRVPTGFFAVSGS